MVSHYWSCLAACAQILYVMHERDFINEKCDIIWHSNLVYAIILLVCERSMESRYQGLTV